MRRALYYLVLILTAYTTAGIALNVFILYTRPSLINLLMPFMLLNAFNCIRWSIQLKGK